GLAPTGLAAADADGDGRLDLVVANAFGDLLVLRGNGDGSFRAFTRADDRVSLQVGDLDGDGRGGDVLLTREGDDRVLVDVRRGAAVLPEQVVTRTDGLSGPAAAALADLNGDGRTDRIVSNRDGHSVLRLVSQSERGLP